MTAPTTFSTVPDALAYLEELGSVDAIAEEMERRAVKGEPKACERCALAVFLMNTVPDLVEVRVDPAYSQFDGSADWATDEQEGSIPLPVRVNKFAIRFDAKVFPDLIEAGV